MTIGIIGAGFTGLATAYRLSKNGHKVVVFEKDSLPGGLAVGYKPARYAKQSVAGGERGWEWTLEKHYHHWFTNDTAILNLANEINHEVIIKRPKTSVYVDSGIYQFDSPKEVLLFPKLSQADRLRMAAVVGLLRYNPLWKPLEKINASTFLPKAMGKKAYEMIWKPLFVNKFGSFADDVSLAWFWARITKRTPSLAYPKGGFLDFANHLVTAIEQKGGKVLFTTEVLTLTDDEKTTLIIKNEKGKIGKQVFDFVVFTLPTFLFLKMAPQLPDEYKKTYTRLKGLGATNLILRLKKPFFNDTTYWLSVCDSKSPVMAIVEHTNFMDKKHYNNEHLVYLGNYLSPDDPLFLMNKEEKLKLFDPFLKKINPEYKTHLIDYELFKAPFAQPIIPTNYSKMIPPMETPLRHTFLANIEQVYPWDRGTNYAVGLGEKAARLVEN